jgi:hypothetical protein
LFVCLFVCLFVSLFVSLMVVCLFVGLFPSSPFRDGMCGGCERYGILVARSTLRVPRSTLHVSILADGFGLAQAAARKAEEEAAAAKKKEEEAAAAKKKEEAAAAAKKAQEEAATQVRPNLLS